MNLHKFIKKDNSQFNIQNLKFRCKRRAGVAQLAEQLTCNQ